LASCVELLLIDHVGWWDRALVLHVLIFVVRALDRLIRLNGWRKLVVDLFLRVIFDIRLFVHIIKRSF
jgi:hypothetical protein